ANPFARRQPSHELRGVFAGFLERARVAPAARPHRAINARYARPPSPCMRSSLLRGMDFRRRPSSKTPIAAESLVPEEDSCPRGQKRRKSAVFWQSAWAKL